MKHLNKILAFVLFFSISFSTVRADEGMWLPLYINKIIGNMEKQGCKLSADQIYNINKASVKDGIVHFGGFCTGEIVSSSGLVFTNHHCGYDAIASLSSVTNNYLDNGFWAQNFEQEIPAPGLTASILVYMEDVTARMAAASDRSAEMKKIVDEAKAKNANYKAEVKSYFYGNEYYLLVYEVFKDIRLVATCPQSIGKFGGDTDNWMWPRHTGDFSIFRIYANAENKPADYDKNNKPYTPKYFFPVNKKGVNQGDFVMIMGFPGRTTRYLTKDNINTLTGVDYQSKAKVLKEKLSLWNNEMMKDVALRLKLSGDYASYMNSQKYYEGVMNAIKTSPCLGEKTKLEEGFMAWVNSDENRKKEYGSVYENIKTLYNDNKQLIEFSNYLNFGYFGIQMTGIASSMATYTDSSLVKIKNQAFLDETLKAIKTESAEYLYSYSRKVDEKVFAAVLRMVHQNLDKKFWVNTLTASSFIKVKSKIVGKDKYDAYANWVYNTSVVTDSTRLANALAKPDAKKWLKDPAIAFGRDVMTLLYKYTGDLRAIGGKRDGIMKTYVKGLREYQSDKFFYPDANSTLRLTYGTVKGYEPRDGMNYTWVTTHKGILEKYKENDPEFHVPAELMTALKANNFGEYGLNGNLPISFLSNLDITGGNSGSPVINGKGELVGIAYDGVWEGMVGDIYFDDKYNRTISVDIRYILFLLDKVYPGKRLINELTVVQ